MIDIFNKRKKGIRGSAVFTGQPGIGEHHYWYLTVTSNQQTRENMPVVFHPYPLHHSRPAIVFQDMFGKTFIIDDGVRAPEERTGGIGRRRQCSYTCRCRR
jgi:hypothetical protein